MDGEASGLTGGFDAQIAKAEYSLEQRLIYMHILDFAEFHCAGRSGKHADVVTQTPPGDAKRSKSQLQMPEKRPGKQQERRNHKPIVPFSAIVVVPVSYSNQDEAKRIDGLEQF
jgi:hypothetical protein